MSYPPEDFNDRLVIDSGKPQVADLIDEFKRCTPVQTGWHRLSTNEAIRFCRWEGQDADGKKWDRNMPEGKEAFPFDGASDARTFIIDEAIEEIVAVEFVAFFRALLRVQGTNANDMEGAAYINKLLEWVIGTKQFHSLRREVELSSQYTHTYGWCVLQVYWLQEHVLKLVKATLEEILQMAQQAAASGQQTMEAQIIASLPGMILDPTQDANFVQLMMSLTPGLTKKRAGQMVRDLRKVGEAEVPMPSLARDEPIIRALKPWEEVFLSNTVTDVQHARVFVKEWLNETQIRSMVYTDGWDEEWVDKACKLKGQFSTFGAPTVVGGDGTAADVLRMAGENFAFTTYQSGTDLIEIIHAYTRRLDEDNVPGIYRTTFNANIVKSQKDPERELCAKHERYNYRHGRMPFVVRKREEWARTITSSRGLPEIFHTTQRSYKSQEDGLVDSTSLSVMPPIIVPELLGVDYEFGPGKQIPEAVPGRAPRVMPMATPGAPVAFQLMELLDRRVNRRVGKRLLNEPPEGADAMRQKLVQGHLVAWSEAFGQELQLLEQFLDSEEFMRVTGSPQAMAQDSDTIARQYDFILTFDPRELSIDYVMTELKAIKDMVLPVDAMGTIDRGKLVELLLRAINPTLAKELVLSPQSASQQIFKQVKLDLLSMMAGFSPEYTEMDPTASAQLQFAKQLVGSNPRVQEAMQRDERFRELLANWEKNRQQSVLQEQNKMVGRLGVRTDL